ncbi:MAG: ECF transporter S component [Tissierellia bacterium]|nr:ECF transporter S component [Tissierellia bacterium]
MALTVLATMLVTVPTIATQGYINLGDAIVLLSGMILGPGGGFVVGGLGSALADIILGYSYYAPFTLVIKGIEGALGVFLFRKILKEKNMSIPLVVAGIWMAIGYLLAEILLYDFPAAIASFPGNLLQGIVGAILASLLYKNIKNKI